MHSISTDTGVPVPARIGSFGAYTERDWTTRFPVATPRMSEAAAVTIDPEFQALIPALSPEERIGLEALIVQAGGATDSLKVWDNKLLDGHNRHAICLEHGLPYSVTKVAGIETRADAKIWIIEHQFGRRNLSPFVRIELGLVLEAVFAERARERRGTRTDLVATLPLSPGSRGKTRDKVAEVAKVGGRTVDKAKVIVAKATEETKAKLRVGTTTISKEYKAIVAAERKVEQVEAVKHAALPVGKYSVIVSDPPWSYQKRAEDVTHRGACPYPCMSIEAICAIPVAGMAADDAILWLWTTNAHMGEAYEVAQAWGFAVKTILTWVKDHMGMGDWLRGQTEHCLMCVRGKPVVTLTNQTTVLRGPMREHSRKPDEFFAMVEALCPAPDGGRVEMFCRQKRPGWIATGAEIGMFGEVA